MRLLNWLRNALPGSRPIPLKDMRKMDGDRLLRRSRAMASAVYVGDRTVVCRVLTRYRLYVASDDVGFGVHVMLDGLWEGWLTAFMARRIAPGMRIVDAGANHGYYTVLFAHLTGADGHVAAIEPNPRTAGLLRKSIYANGFDPRVTVFALAAGAEDDVTLHLEVPDHEPKNAHLVGEARPGTVAVRGARLDTLLADWPRVDFMKVDVEGNVYCTGPGGIWILTPAGEHLGTILMEGRTSNMNWGDDDWRTLYFTGARSLHRIRLNIPGVPVPRGALTPASS